MHLRTTDQRETGRPVSAWRRPSSPPFVTKKRKRPRRFESLRPVHRGMRGKAGRYGVENARLRGWFQLDRATGLDECDSVLAAQRLSASGGDHWLELFPIAANYLMRRATS